MQHAAKFLTLLLAVSIATSVTTALAAADSNADANNGVGKKIVFVAGHASHGYAQHEYAADSQMLAKMLEKAYPGLKTACYKNGWPTDPKFFDGASTIVVFADGGGGNLMLRHLDEIDKMMKRGVGLACIHYTVEIPKGKPGDMLSDWIGGHYEQFWSINPWWKADFKQFPTHPITRGVRPFAMNDEWYYHMRFVENMDGVTPILTAVPPNRTREGKDGPHSGNPTVRAERDKAEHLAWARVRPDGGRGFGFTGGHVHWNFASHDYRTVILNGIAWTAKLAIPEGGVPSANPTFEELAGMLDKPQPANFNREQTKKMIEQWK